MHIEVDRDRCEGNAVCVGIAPEVFVLDAEDYAVIVTDELSTDQLNLVERSIADCPRAAIALKM